MTIFDEINGERVRQDQQWGGPDHDDRHDRYNWTSFIRHRTQEIVRESYSGVANQNVRQLYIEIAALAVAAIESIDRKRARGEIEWES